MSSKVQNSISQVVLRPLQPSERSARSNEHNSRGGQMGLLPKG